MRLRSVITIGGQLPVRGTIIVFFILFKFPGVPSPLGPTFPEIYSKKRKITVAGKIVEYNEQKVNNYPNPYLKIESREIYLWPESEQEYFSPYYDYGYYPFPYPLHRYRYYRHGW